LSKDNYDGSINGLKTWFENAAIDWRKNYFQYTDESGSEYDVRLWDEVFSMEEYASNRYRIRILLREEI